MISNTKPIDFNSKFKVVSCFIEYNGEILMLKRQTFKPQPNTYGLPAGKVEKGETVEQAMLREVKEETGIELENEKYEFYKIKYVSQDNIQFTYYSYFCKLDYKPDVKINPNEHQLYLWITPKDAMKLNLIQDGDNCLKDFYNL